MLHALLHGKLDAGLSEPERLEDTLTSSVFGTLVLLGEWDLLARWLLQDPTAAQPDNTTGYWFWPRLSGAVEPDVVLRIGQVLVVVEAKYRSGRNDLAVDELDKERPVDQIVRQFHAVSPPHERRSPYPDLLERAVRDCRIVQAFVVDGRRMRSCRHEHQESKNRLPPGATLKLVTWQALYKLLLDPPSSGMPWATDLRKYLWLSELASFHGIRRRVADAAALQVISAWSPVLERTRIVPGLVAAGAMLAAEPAIVDLPRWRVTRRA
jgi:hypothetical protein